MTTKRKPRLPDPNEMAFGVLQAITGDLSPDPPSGKNPVAVALGKLGGAKGGKARAKSMTKKQRSEAAR